MKKPDHGMPPRFKNPWALRGLIAAVAVLPVMAYLSWTPLSWWSASGFLTYPGTFMRVSDDHYRTCRPWPKAGIGANHRERLASRSGWITGKKDFNLAVLLPQTAQITAIYCGAAPAPSSPAECTNAHCPEGIHAVVDDGVYTRGRGVIFSVRDRTAKPDQRTNVGFWVTWR
jgi:hypothetical protein